MAHYRPSLFAAGVLPVIFAEAHECADKLAFDLLKLPLPSNASPSPAGLATIENLRLP